MGTSWLLASKSANGSAQMRTAPTSLVASDRCAFRMVGACHQSSVSGPPPPGRPAVAGAAVGAAAPTVAGGAALVAAGCEAGAVVAGAVAAGWAVGAGLAG